MLYWGMPKIVDIDVMRVARFIVALDEIVGRPTFLRKEDQEQCLVKSPYQRAVESQEDLQKKLYGEPTV